MMVGKKGAVARSLAIFGNAELSTDKVDWHKFDARVADFAPIIQWATVFLTLKYPLLTLVVQSDSFLPLV